MDKIISNFTDIAHLIRTHDTDWVHVNISRERGGKSTLAILEQYIADAEFNKKPDVNRIAFSKEQWDEAVNGSTESAIIGDEPIHILYGADAMKTDTKDTIKDIITSGYKHHLYILNWTDYRLIHPYLRRNRIDSVARVVKRGWMHFFSQRSVDKIMVDSKTDEVKYPEPDFKDSFPSISNQSAYWQAYQKRKDDWRQEGAKSGELKKRANMTEEEMAYKIMNSPELYSLIVHKWGQRPRADDKLISVKFSIGGLRAVRVKRFVESLVTEKAKEEAGHDALHALQEETDLSEKFLGRGTKRGSRSSSGSSSNNV